MNSLCIPNFDKMEVTILHSLQIIYIPCILYVQGNDQCIQIPWRRDPDVIEAWKMVHTSINFNSKSTAIPQARTGYPYIDAIMTQLRVQGEIGLIKSISCSRLNTV